MSRLLELLCLSVLRSQLLSGDSAEAAVGWARGLSDPLLMRVLQQFHTNPGAMWSVVSLARVAGLSPSRFAARFAAAIGESPMSYVTRWRMSFALRYLRTTDMTTDRIAHCLGYTSVPAFSRVFRRFFAASPKQWRRQQIVDKVGPK